MKQLDDRILEHLAGVDWASPQTIESKEGFESASAGRIEERCCLLKYAELIEPLVNGSEMYCISGKGRRYLIGDYDVEWLALPASAVMEAYGRRVKLTASVHRPGSEERERS
jgi:hypothetical protein